MTDNSPGEDRAKLDRGDELEASYESLLSSLVDRLIDGESLDTGAICEEYPDVGARLVDDLCSFIGPGSPGSRSEDASPLGSLGDFTLRRRLGSGGMGVVYEAWQGSMDRVVALKVLPPGVAADDRAYARFMKEARAAGKLSHPNVVAVHASGQDDQTPYYAMEFIDGETLAELLSRSKSSGRGAVTAFGAKEEIAYFGNLAAAFAEVADGLHHAHSLGVIHRDLKPSNLILDRESRLRVVDFGLARLEGSDSITYSGDVVGTPLYMSPEQARRRRIRIDHRTDVYSLGATIYECLAGRPPFRGKNYADTLTQVIARDPPRLRTINPRVPKDLETIVFKSLEKDPDDRYRTAEALSQDLRRFARGEPVEARMQSRWRSTLKLAWRYRNRAGVAVSVALLVLTSGTLLLEYRQESHRERSARYRTLVEEAVMRIQLGDLAIGAWTGDAVRSHRVEGATNAASGHSWQRGKFSSEGRDAIEAAIERLRVASRTLPSRGEADLHWARALLLLGKREDARKRLDRGRSARTRVCSLRRFSGRSNSVTRETTYWRRAAKFGVIGGSSLIRPFDVKSGRLPRRRTVNSSNCHEPAGNRFRAPTWSATSVALRRSYGVRGCRNPSNGSSRRARFGHERPRRGSCWDSPTSSAVKRSRRIVLSSRLFRTNRGSETRSSFGSRVSTSFTGSTRRASGGRIALTTLLYAWPCERASSICSVAMTTRSVREEKV